MTPLRIFIGFDSREPVAFHVLSSSILRRASRPVAIIPLVQAQLRAAGTYTRGRGPLESTEFSLTRFLVPYLSGFEGWSVFMDSDMLVRCDITDLWLDVATQQSKAVLVCPHDYTPIGASKMDGQAQTAYPRKNWSSFVLFNNSVCSGLTPTYVNGASPLDLHRFAWLEEWEIGHLPLSWNHLVGEYPADPSARVLHYTRGGPWLDAYRHCDQAQEWHSELAAMSHPLWAVA